MKNFILIWVCMSAGILHAQTTVIKKYPNGVSDTIWHIRNQDTFLIEKYRPNNTLSERIWRKDSAYSYDSHKNIIEKKYYFKNQSPKIQFCPESDFYTFARTYSKKQSFFPNGNLAQQMEWSGDTLWKQTIYNVHGKILKQNIFHKIKPFLSEWVVQKKYDKEVSRYNIVDSIGKRWVYDAKGQLSHFRQYRIRYFFYESEPSRLTQYVLYDSVGKKKMDWHLDSNQVIPFKDNGLCLYGFVNLKGDTLISARYEGVQEVGESFNPSYIVHTATQYGILDAFGNATIAPNWTFLARFKPHDDIDSVLEQTYLRCRTPTGFGIIRLNGQIILPPVYQDIRKYKNDLFEVKIGGSWGIVDAKGQIVVKPLYPHLDFTPYADLYLVKEVVQPEEQNRYSLIRQDGHVLLNSAFDEIKSIGNRTFLVESYQEYEPTVGPMGIFHAEKGWIYDTLYYVHTPISDYLLLRKSKTKQTMLVDLPTMQPILPSEYNIIETVRLKQWNPMELDGVQTDTLLLTQKGNKRGLFDPRTRKWVLPLEYDFLKNLNMDSLFVTLKNGVWAIRNAHGQIVHNQSYTHIGYLESGYFGQRGDSVLFFTQRSFPVPVPAAEEDVLGRNRKLNLLHTVDRKTLLVNYLQKIVVPIAFQIGAVNGDFAVVQDTVRHIQFLTDYKGGKMVLKPQFEVLEMNLDENVIIVRDSTTQQLGAIRKEGDFILPAQYFALYSLDSAGVIWAKKEASPPLSGKQWLRDRDRALDYERDTIHDFDKGWKMYDKTGRLLTHTLFEYAFEWHDSVGIGLVNGKFGLWHASGKNLVLPNYDKIEYDGFSKIYHLFELQTLDNPLVGFANAKGEIIVDGLFKKMSLFSSQYAFVETAQGLGIISKTGQYLVEPKPHSIQQSVLKLMPLMDTLHQSNANIFAFAIPIDTLRSPFNKSFYRLSTGNQLLIHNLLMEYVAPSYFIQPNRITYDRSSQRLRSVNKEFESHPQRIFNSLITKVPHIGEVVMTPKYINFTMYDKDFRLDYSDDIRGGIRKSLNFKWVNGVWEKIKLDNLLNINDENKALFLKLFAQKLSALKQTDLDCSDPSKYMERVQNNFYVLEEGMKFHLQSGGRFYRANAEILFSWAELKPFLRF